MSLAQVAAGTPTELPPNVTVQLPGGYQASYQTVSIWTEAERNAQSIYTIQQPAIAPGFYIVSYTLQWTGSVVNQINVTAAYPPAQATRGVLFSKTGANFNSTSDQALTASQPFSSYIVDEVMVFNASVSMTTAKGGFYSAVSKGGTTIVPAAQNYTALTDGSKTVSPSLGPSGTDKVTGNTLYASLTTPQGSTATADILVWGTFTP